ncbi:uncharacterized protein G2W53_027297 [Senna tora]|uniref:Uncharacterized protein n=1 Tax=Senna tora TaxID=362788 RepID=A0A834WGH7_9FABA|nr:uncharacterized protein G2W53_027297 [Senna tora]
MIQLVRPRTQTLLVDLCLREYRFPSAYLLYKKIAGDSVRKNPTALYHYLACACLDFLDFSHSHSKAYHRMREQITSCPNQESKPEIKPTKKHKGSRMRNGLTRHVGTICRVGGLGRRRLKETEDEHIRRQNIQESIK